MNIRKRLELIKSYIGGEDYLGFAILVIGVLGFFDYPLFGLQLPYITGWTDFYKRIWPELIGIGITVLIIDNANKAIKRREQEHEEKKRLILQMGSPENAFAIEAVRQLRERKWLLDGSLHGIDLREADLRKANLEGAKLREAKLWAADLREAKLWLADLRGAKLWAADLREADLVGANLRKADLREAKLREASLWNADLREAKLWNADLREADLAGAKLREASLWGANLEGAKVTPEQLDQAKSLEGATLPDGSLYKPPSSDDKQ